MNSAAIAIEKRIKLVYTIGLKLVCDVKDGFLRKTYIAGKAIFFASFS